MKELEYPFDTDYIIRKKKKIKKELLADSGGFVEKHIAILGGYTTAEIKDMLELFLLNYQIKPTFYESEYNQYYEDAMFPNKQLEDFKPDVIYICTSNRNVMAKPQISHTRENVDEILNVELSRFRAMWDRLSSVYGCSIIQNNMEMPLYRLLGNRDVYDWRGYTNYLMRLNEGFYEYAIEHEHFHICDVNYISADYSLKEWSNPFYWYMYKYALNVNAIPYLCFNVANIIKSIFGKNKKGLVLDLDNTLWGGVIGDDGIEGIELGPEESYGQVFSEFQHYLKEQKQIGVVLTIDSKNDEENVLEGLQHPDSELSTDDFAVIMANWNSKDQNILQIADKLSLLPESFVFIDDNPVERHIVSEQIKGVAVPDIGKSYQYIQNIDKNGYFEVTTLSKDDLNRNDMYKQNTERHKLMASFANYREYLLDLQMKAEIRSFDDIYMSRIAQLTNKSNQFNLTTRRYTQEEIERISKDESYITLRGKLEDRFGDNGVVSVVIGKVDNGKCDIILWLMSCRVLKRDMEYAMMDSLIAECKSRRIDELYGYYYKTAKNDMVKNFYEQLGFVQIGREDNGDSRWHYRILESYEQKNNVIKL